MNPVRWLRQIAGLTQSALAECAGTSQPTVSAYEAGRKSPTLGTVERLARSVGLEAVVEFHPPATREDRRSLALHRAIAERLAADAEAVLDRARENLHRMRAATPGSSQVLEEWGVILNRPVSALQDLLTDSDPWARELRHVTPFGGVLDARERAEVYGKFMTDERRRAS